MLKGLHGLAPGCSPCSPGPGSAPAWDFPQVVLPLLTHAATHMAALLGMPLVLNVHIPRLLHLRIGVGMCSIALVSMVSVLG